MDVDVCPAHRRRGPAKDASLTTVLSWWQIVVLVAVCLPPQPYLLDVRFRLRVGIRVYFERPVSFEGSPLFHCYRSKEDGTADPNFVVIFSPDARKRILGKVGTRDLNG
jgi:hypothetical protein